MSYGLILVPTLTLFHCVSNVAPTVALLTYILTHTSMESPCNTISCFTSRSAIINTYCATAPWCLYSVLLMRTPCKGTSVAFLGQTLWPEPKVSGVIMFITVLYCLWVYLIDYIDRHRVVN